MLAQVDQWRSVANTDDNLRLQLKFLLLVYFRWNNKKVILNRTAIEQLGFNSPAEAAHQFVYFNSN
ncbi:MAG: hypothetical protein AAF599_02175, partial [Bacteroidota bacterium]